MQWYRGEERVGVYSPRAGLHWWRVEGRLANRTGAAVTVAGERLVLQWDRAGPGDEGDLDIETV